MSTITTGKSRSRRGRRLAATFAVGLALLLPLTATSGQASANPFARDGMWIWYVSAAQGGDPDRIIARAKAAGIGTLYIKSADGTGTWSQFTKPLVRRFQRAGLKVCGWHYVYGTRPVREAEASAAAKRQGADCFVIDAEAEYERNNQYAKADRYIRKLRSLVGPKFPIGLSSFPYTHYHPAFPYSVFMGPGGATANLPQVYWKTIGDTARESLSITWVHNALYRRPIFPLGQTYLDPSRRSVENFRRFLLSYDRAPSWWSWQHTGSTQWQALRRKITTPFPNYRPEREHMVLERGDRGDQVVWLQQLLHGAGFDVPFSGVYGRKTRRAVVDFQKSRSLVADGVTGSSTWRRLVKVRPTRVLWGKAGSSRTVRSVVASPPAPLSASLGPGRDELAGPADR